MLLRVMKILFWLKKEIGSDNMETNNLIRIFEMQMRRI